MYGKLRKNVTQKCGPVRLFKLSLRFFPVTFLTMPKNYFSILGFLSLSLYLSIYLSLSLSLSLILSLINIMPPCKINFLSPFPPPLLPPFSSLVRFIFILKLTMTTTGFVLILFALAAYLRVLELSEKLDLAGDTQAI